MQKSRNSRRSACDRCRNYKLRCQRSSLRDELSSCDRCFRTGATCLTTTAPSGHSTQRLGAGGPSARHATLSQSTAHQSVIEHRSSTDNPSTEQGETGSQPRAGNQIDLMELGISTPMSHSSNDFGFSLDDPSTRPTNPKSHEQINHLPSMLTPLSNDELACFGDSRIDLDSSLPSATSSVGPTPNLLQVLFNLCAKLTGDLAILDSGHLVSSDPESPNRIDTAVENALSSTAKISDIIRAMKTADAGQEQREQQRTGSMGQHHSSLSSPQGALLSPTSLRGSQSWEGSWGQTSRMGHSTESMYRTGIGASTPSPRPGKRGDIMFTTTLVNAYILLVRVWTKTYSHLHHILLSRPQGEISELLGLPSLQLGGYIVGSNPAVQITVLLELSSSMLKVIETSLGLGNSIGTGYGRRDSPHDDANMQSLNMDAVSVSVRETLLSQETYRVSTEEGELSLRRIMDKIREQLDIWR